MTVFVQLAHPRIDPLETVCFDRVAGVFLKLFRLNEESAYLFWSSIPLRFRYRQDLYRNFDNILAMVWMIHQNQEGGTTVELQNQLVRMDWEIHWDAEVVSIQNSTIAHEDLYAPYAAAINEKSALQVPRSAFLREWNTLLHQIIVSFEAANIEIEDGTERRKLELLQRVTREIGQFGRLYTRDSEGLETAARK